MARPVLDMSLIGMESIIAKLSKLPTTVRKKAVRIAAKQAAEPIKTLAQAMAPVGETGNLARYIKIGQVANGAVVKTGTRKQLGIDPNDPYYYPAAIEFGHGNVPAKPFLRPAMDIGRRRAIEIMGEVIGKSIKQAWKKK